MALLLSSVWPAALSMVLIAVQVAVFAAVTTIPHWFVELFARTAEALSTDLPSWAHVRGFRNIGAFVGLLERPLFLGALVAGYPQFIAVWFVFKGIAGYRVGLSKTQARRTFQLFLLNNAVSLEGLALGWLACCAALVHTAELPASTGAAAGQPATVRPLLPPGPLQPMNEADWELGVTMTPAPAV